MKLGLKIEITSEGAGNAAKTYNSTPALEKYASASRSFIKDVFPVREDLKLKGIDPLTSLDESARSVVFLRFFGPAGYLICVFQARPENSGRPYDGAAAWIHVPSSVMLSGVQAEKLIDEVDAAMSEERGINYQKLDILFAEEYEEKKILSALSRIVSNGPTAGIRYYGVGTDFQLSELLGNNIAQQVYSYYKAVFFLRKNDGIAVCAPEISAPLSQICIVSAPSPVRGYNAFLEDGKRFNVDLEYPLNAPLTIVWKKDGYQDIVRKANVKPGSSNDIAQLFINSNAEVKVAIKRQIFNVTGGGRMLTNYNISIDGNALDNVLYIQEEKLAEGVSVKICAEGFQSYCKKMELAANTQHLEIQLHRESFQIKRSGMKEAIKHYAYGFLICVGIILAVLLYLYNVIEGIDDVKFKFGWPPIEFVMHSSGGSTTGTGGTTDNGVTTDNDVVTETETIDNYSPERAIAYLNSNNVWCSDSIAKYPSLKGLFEALNEYKFDEIVDKWATNLQDVPTFNNVVQAASLAKTAQWNPRQGNHNPKYNNDNLISLDTYTHWISADQTPKPEIVKTQPANHIKQDQKPAAKPTTPAINNDTKKKRGQV